MSLRKGIGFCQQSGIERNLYFFIVKTKNQNYFKFIDLTSPHLNHLKTKVKSVLKLHSKSLQSQELY